MGPLGGQKGIKSGLSKVTGEKLSVLKRQSTFDWTTRLSELYTKISFIRKDKVSGRDVYVFEATPAEGKPDTLYFDSDTALLLRMDFYYEGIKGKPEPTELYYEDYRDVDGVKLAFTQRQVSSNYSITLKAYEVKHNIPIDNAKFDRPSKQ